MNVNGRYAVVLVNLGGPASPEEVKPFLKNLFSDPDIMNFPFGRIGQSFFSSMIAHFRSPKSRANYEKIGGGSPLRKNTEKQAKKLEQMLRAHGDFKVFPTQRYWHPLIRKTAGEIENDHFDRVILLPLFPQFSKTTTESVLNEWNRHADKIPETVSILNFYRESGYLKACSDKIETEIGKFDQTPHLLFSAHSIPLSGIESGDPYEREIMDTAELIVKELHRPLDYSLCYQSKVGPVKWLEPSISQKLKELRERQIRHVLVYPISFVSEHLETLYELDIQYRELAESLGFIQYCRAETVQDDDQFISALKDLILGQLEIRSNNSG